MKIPAASTKKLLVLGVDGMDPRITKYLMDKGELPAIKEYVKRGACREDLVMLGAVPTITPPMWTTMATGAYPATHGITCFWNSDPVDKSKLIYSLDSTMCKAEAVWNATAEAGLRTLVWHWPGSSWPPTSDSPNLHVVDGTQPGFINFGVALREDEVLIIADKRVDELKFIPSGGHANIGAGCLISDVDVKEASTGAEVAKSSCEDATASITNVMLELEDGEYSLELMPYDAVNSPLKPAQGWANAPEGALEFTVLLSKGYLHRPCLLLQDVEGNYYVEMYKNKKDEKPMVTLKNGELSDPVVDDIVKEDGERIKCFRPYKFVYINEEGSSLNFWAGRAFECDNDVVWHPKSLYKDIIENVGYFMTASSLGGIVPFFTGALMLPTWERYNDWQANSLNYLMEEDRYDVIFTHLHNVDGMGHNIWPHCEVNKHTKAEDVEQNREYMAEVYRQTDRYLAKFLPWLDKGWTIIITSDHGLIVDSEEEAVLMGDPYGVNAKIMNELGFTALKKDENGNNLKEIDWSHTKAIAVRTCHIYLNLKGRDPYGIVEPEDRYKVEEEIIDALYNYRDPNSGRRIIALALRNKDALLLGASGPEFGDIVYWLEEGFHRVHGDSLSTHLGVANTSVSPIFIAAGEGIKPGYTERVIREVDLAPTIATLLGVRMPAQCEGAPVYQIIE